MASASAEFTVTEPPSSDATLSSLTLSGVDFGTFDPATTGYAASVANDVAETTVTPTVNDDGAAYVIKLDGDVDEDGTVALAEGENTISVVVTAEDGNTARTYTVTVTRASAEPTPSSPPDTPDTPTGERIVKGQVWLDWNDVEGATYYQVRAWIGGKWVELPTGEIEIVIKGSGATISGLPVGPYLHFSVRAGNGAGVSDWSDHLGFSNPED